MDGLEALFANRVLWAAMLGWAIAQTFKVMLTFIVYKRWDFSRMFGSGGMPSSHSSFIMRACHGGGHNAWLSER